MNELYIKRTDLSIWLGKKFKQDIISVADLIARLEELYGEVETLEEQFEDYKEYVSENYKQIPKSYYEEYGISEKDFH